MAGKPRPTDWIWTACQTCDAIFRVFPSRISKCCSKECAKPFIGKQHGESRSRLHGIWCHMKSRCCCETSKVFNYYGGRGITVCESWSTSYESFSEWALTNGYSEELELDRIDVNGNYEPSNCRWATRKQQMRNTRKKRDAKTSRFKGVSRHSQNGRWVCQVGGRVGKKSSYAGLFDTEEDAAREYDRIMQAEFKGFAVLNFPTQGGVSR